MRSFDFVIEKGGHELRFSTNLSKCCGIGTSISLLVIHATVSVFLENQDRRMIWSKRIAEILLGVEMKMAGKEVLAGAKLIGMNTEIVNNSGLGDELSAPASFAERRILYSKSKYLGANLVGFDI